MILTMRKWACVIFKINLIVVESPIRFDLCSSAEPDKKLTRPPNFVLVLRRWYDLSHSTEFRCFVSNRNLRAISQRDPTKHFPFLLRLREELESLIATFFELNIQDEFPDVDGNERLFLFIYSFNIYLKYFFYI